VGYEALVRRPGGVLRVRLGNKWTYESARARLVWAETSRALRAELPTSNGGSTTPDAARACLDELRHFQADARWGCIQLVDDETSDVLHTYEWTNLELFARDELFVPPYVPDGTGGVRAPNGDEADRWALWVASPFAEPIEAGSAVERFTERNPRWRLGECELSFLPLSGGPSVRLARPLSLVPALADWELHEFTINALIVVLHAAVEDDLPVEWC